MDTTGNGLEPGGYGGYLDTADLHEAKQLNRDVFTTLQSHL